MRILHIVARYYSSQLTLNEENFCVVTIRGEEPKLISVQQAHLNLYDIPYVNGCGGIIESYIFNTETKTFEYLNPNDYL